MAKDRGGSTKADGMDRNPDDEAETMITLLNSRLRELQKAQTVLFMETEKIRAERDKLNTEHRALISQLREHRSGDQQVKEQVNELRTKVEEERNLFLVARKQAEQIRDEVAQAGSRVKSRPEDVSKELHQLNWEIQTSPTNVAREKELMKRIIELSHEQSLHGQISRLDLSLVDARAKELGAGLALKRDRDALHELHEARDSLRAKIDELSEKATSIKSKADEAHQRYLGKRAEIASTALKIGEVKLELMNFRGKLEAKRKEEEARQKEEEKKRMIVIADETRRKLGKGEKITFQELQTLSVEED